MSENFELFDLAAEIPGDMEVGEESFDVSFQESQQTFEADFESSAVEADVSFENVQQVGVPVPGGTFDHAQLLNRDASDQHPMSAISGLEKALEGKQPSGAYLTKETDPTVPAWAKKSTKPTYTASEIGALPNTTKIPSKTSDLINDSGFITGFTEKDPTVPSWAKQPQKPVYKASEVGADPSGSAAAALKSAQDYTDKKIASIPTPDVSGQISEHNTDPASHGDIRLLISGLTERLNALANSDDTTLDQMAEVVAYIKDNRELIEQVTTGKVSVSDIVDNLTTNVSDKPLSAAQGVLLKGLVDSLTTAVGGKLDASALTEAINTALYQAKESGEFDGQQGKDGKNGIVISAAEPEPYPDGTHPVWVQTDGENQNAILQAVYPIGSIYFSTVSLNPADLFGFGTWERIQDTFLLAAGETFLPGDTGGETEHTLTMDEVPEHTHRLKTGSDDDVTGTGTWVFYDHKISSDSSNAAFRDLATMIEPIGGGQSHNNMPPYLAVYVWKRTA